MQGEYVMENKDLIDRIVQEVLKKLNILGAKEFCRYFVGALLAQKQPFWKLKTSSLSGYDIQAVLTPAAEKLLA